MASSERRSFKICLGLFFVIIFLFIGIWYVLTSPLVLGGYFIFNAHFDWSFLLFAFIFAVVAAVDFYYKQPLVQRKLKTEIINSIIWIIFFFFIVGTAFAGPYFSVVIYVWGMTITYDLLVPLIIIGIVLFLRLSFDYLLLSRQNESETNSK